MAFQDAKPMLTNQKGPSIKASVRRLASGGSKVVFMLNKAALDQFFPDAKPGDMFKVQHGTAEHAGKAMIFLDAAGHI